MAARAAKAELEESEELAGPAAAAKRRPLRESPVVPEALVQRAENPVRARPVRRAENHSPASQVESVLVVRSM